MTKGKLFLIVLLSAIGIFIVYQFVLFNWSDIQNFFQNTSAVGIIGTLLGAVIGGCFSLLGSVSVSKYQIKAQTRIRRKNVIYKPLYDELMEIHNDILKKNPYPGLISFEKGIQTITKHPQFVAWGRIKADSRYLETPKKLKQAMEKLESDVLAYIEVRNKTGSVITTVLNEILTTELEMTSSIVNIGDVLLPYVLLDNDFYLFKEMHYSNTPHKDIDTATQTKIRQKFIETCRNNREVMCLKSCYDEWQQSEKYAISLLSVMIQRVNTEYEG